MLVSLFINTVALVAISADLILFISCLGLALYEVLYTIIEYTLEMVRINQLINY